ncbi:MAG: amidohydrolase family protein [Proteobacteria bacterium]|nr:amidohydrolase family protein [Pseudomonadota bacterium]
MPPLADVHLHYNGNQEGVVDPEEAIAILKQQNVKLAVVSSTPPELALALRNAGGDWVIPLFRPYFSEQQRHRWFADRTVLPLARKALASGEYKGIGELHLIAGLGPGRKNKILHGLIQLGIEFDVPLLIHIETSSERYFIPLCQQYPKARFLIAHAGGLLDADQMGNLLTTCGNVWTEFSARDHMRYVQSPIVDDNGNLLPGWRKLIEQHPQRFMIGSDPFWPVEKEMAMEEPDTGWLHVNDYLDFHRHWLKELPDQTRRKLEIENAQAFFRHQGQ